MSCPHDCPICMSARHAELVAAARRLADETAAWIQDAAREVHIARMGGPGIPIVELPVSFIHAMATLRIALAREEKGKE